MDDSGCIRFLQWALPRLHMRWPGFRRVRGQVCKRLDRRLHQLGLGDGRDYQDYLGNHPEEWRILDGLCRVTISRFYRDKMVFARLADDVLPTLFARAHSRGEARLRAWSVGCASGEEPYTLALVWHFALKMRFPGSRIDILASDADPFMLERAQRACYPFSSVKNLPAHWRERAFTESNGQLCLNAPFRLDVTWLEHDVRGTPPPGPFDIILCRNLVFTYFDEPLQRQTLERLRRRLIAGGALLVGVHETLPAGTQGFTPWDGRLGIYRKIDSHGSTDICAKTASIKSKG